jgi:RNA polymerase sigma-70 factor, ECF subfamily
MIAFRRRKSYDLSRADHRPWLFGIAANLRRQHRRSEERQLRAFARAADGSGQSGWLEERLDPTVAAALLDLNQDDRNLILLYAWGRAVVWGARGRVGSPPRHGSVSTQPHAFEAARGTCTSQDDGRRGG